MAKKISQLTQATEVKSDDVTVIVQDGETKKLPLNMMVTKQDIENKKVAGLAKLDEIEATYENDTYTPTITVKNKSSVKTGEGDEVDYSANVMDGHVKSAILKGQTLVNLVPNKGENTIVGTGGRLIKYELPYILSKNKKYLLCCNIKTITTPSNTGQISFSLYSDDGNTTQLLLATTSTGYLKKIFTTLDQDYSTQKLWVYIRSNETTSATFDNIMLLEYQEGMENWDIPYFEGMQSVKMPVLTTTGKNLFDYTYWYPLILHNFDYTITGNKINTIIPSGKWFLETKRTNFDKLKEDTIYTISATSVNSLITILFWKPDGTFIFERGVRNTPITFTTPNEPFVVSMRFCRRLDSDNTVDVQASCENIQIEEGTVATTYEPFKSNILSTPEDLELRGIGNVKDTLDLTTGELTQRIGEVVLDGSENWTYEPTYTNDNVYGCYILINQLPQIPKPSNFNFANNVFPNITNSSYQSEGFATNPGTLSLRIAKDKLESADLSGFKKYLQNHPVILQYPLATPTIKTVDLMPSGTHPSTTPYCWKNGHIQLSSSGLLPSLEYSVVTSRAGQINQNATMIVKNDKRIFDLEILLAGGLVNTTYQALTLQNQVETGLSKVSLNSETEPDYLLYHMIMKLIEEKAYKLDDLTEKVSVFYLYEKLSDEQFETIYSALYPFVEDEIVEEPVVEELSEVVEDEVIM